MIYTEDTTMEDLLDKYGIDQILFDNGLSLVKVLTILSDLGYIYPEAYLYDEKDGM